MANDIIGRARVIITGDVDSTSVDASGKKIGSSLKAGAAVGVAALGTLATAGVKLYQEFEQAESQSRKLNTVLDNMGEGQAAPAVEKLADELMRLSGVDDEVIKGGQTILATFDAVNDSAGELGGTFERATRLSVDMASIFGSVESGARILGKALEDPEKAAARLARANVILNEDQQRLIDNFLAAGDAAGAQDVILDALEDRYKGTAEAAATESQKITTAFEELKENAGSLVADLAESIAGEGDQSLSGSIYEASDAVTEFSESDSWAALRRQIGTTARTVKQLAGPLDETVGFVTDLTEALGPLAAGFKVTLKPLETVQDLVQILSGDYSDLYKAIYKVNDLLGRNPVTSDDVPDAPDISQPRSTRASGGPASGWTVVNENGPELIRLPNNSYVYPTGASKEMLSGGKGGDFILQNYGPISGADILDQWKWANRFSPRFGAGTASVAG